MSILLEIELRSVTYAARAAANQALIFSRVTVGQES